MANYRIELGFDVNARQLTLNGKSGFYLPAGLTKQDTNGEFVLATYSELKVNDTIAMRLFDFTGSLSEFTEIRLNFESARVGMSRESPFGKNLKTDDFLIVVGKQKSAIFPRIEGVEEFDAVDIHLETRTISEVGFFVGVYELDVPVNGMTRTYRHDPEWIIEPF